METTASFTLSCWCWLRNICLIFVLLSIYRQQLINNKNLIGLNRTRRRHNAIFVSFTDTSVPTKCLEGANTNWIKVCQKEHDRQAEEQLRKVSDCKKKHTDMAQ